VDSTACYQSGDSGLSIGDIYELHESLMKYSQDSENVGSDTAFDAYRYSIKGILPDITFFMDVPPEIALNRATERGDTNKFESKKLEFHDKVYERFKTVASTYTDRIISVDADDKSIEEIQGFIRKSIFTK
jgi:dTMP kinase